MEQRIIYQHHLTLIYLISIPNPNTDDIPNANTNASQNPDHLFALKKPQFHQKSVDFVSSLSFCVV